jgi:hypothetical protein
MGKHYVPQEYLRGFASSPERTHVWMFNKATSAWSHPAISKAAQKPDYYSPEAERDLHVMVERPANVALKVLRSGGTMDSEQR